MVRASPFAPLFRSVVALAAAGLAVSVGDGLVAGFVGAASVVSAFMWAKLHLSPFRQCPDLAKNEQGREVPDDTFTGSLEAATDLVVFTGSRAGAGRDFDAEGDDAGLAL